MKEENKALTASQCVSAITGEMSSIQKKKGANVNYAFRGIDEVMDNLNPLLHGYGCALSTKMEVKTDNVFLKKDGIDRKLSTATVTVRINIVKDVVTETGIISTSHSIEGVAYSDDYGDKAATQAQSLAFKYAIIFGFCVRTKDMVEDPDGVQKDHANTTSGKSASNPPQDSPTPKKEATPPPPAWTPEAFETFKEKVVNMPITRNTKDKTKWALKVANASKNGGVFCNATDEQTKIYCQKHATVLTEQGIAIPEPKKEPGLSEKIAAIPAVVANTKTPEKLNENWVKVAGLPLSLDQRKGIFAIFNTKAAELGVKWNESAGNFL